MHKLSNHFVKWQAWNVIFPIRAHVGLLFEKIFSFDLVKQQLWKINTIFIGKFPTMILVKYFCLKYYSSTKSLTLTL